MIAQTGGGTSNKDRKKYMRTEAARRLEDIRQRRQIELSGAARFRISRLSEKHVVVGGTEDKD